MNNTTQSSKPLSSTNSNSHSTPTSTNGIPKTKARPTPTPTSIPQPLPLGNMPAQHTQLQLAEPSPTTSSSSGHGSSANPVRIPRAAASYQADTHDYDLRSQINIQLLDAGLVQSIQQTLLQTLQAHPSDWPARIQTHALHLLRSGECTTFPSLMLRVLADIKADNKKARAMGEYKSISLIDSDEKKGGIRTMKNGTTGGVGGDIGLAIPGTVVEEGVRVTRESLEAVCEIVGGE